MASFVPWPLLPASSLTPLPSVGAEGIEGSIEAPWRLPEPGSQDNRVTLCCPVHQVALDTWGFPQIQAKETIRCGIHLWPNESKYTCLQAQSEQISLLKEGYIPGALCKGHRARLAVPGRQLCGAHLGSPGAAGALQVRAEALRAGVPRRWPKGRSPSALQAPRSPLSWVSKPCGLESRSRVTFQLSTPTHNSSCKGTVPAAPAGC